MTDVAPDPLQDTRTLKISLIALIVVLIVLLGVLLATLLHSGVPNYSSVGGIRPLFVITGPGTGDKPLFDSPMGATFGLNGRIYVADTRNSRIVVFDRLGNYLFQFGGLGVGKPAPGGTYSWRPGLMNYPTDVTTDALGRVYVADFGNDQIEVFTPQGRFIRAFPNPNERVGKGSSGKNGTGIAVTSLAVANGRVYATDKYQVLVFTTYGRLIEQFGKPGLGPADLDHPNGIAVAADSTVIVSDSNHNRVLGLTAVGLPLWSAGRAHPIDSSLTSEFDVPRGLATLSDGSVIVADALASHLVLLSRSGRVLTTYGRRGSAPGAFYFPTDIATEPDGPLVIAEKGNNRVQVVALDR